MRKQLILLVCVFLLWEFNEGKGARRPIYRNPSPPSGKTYHFALGFQFLYRLVPGSTIKMVDAFLWTETPVCPDFRVQLDNVN